MINVAAHKFPRADGKSHIRIGREWPIFGWYVVPNLLRRKRSAEVAVTDVVVPRRDQIDNATATGEDRV